ncbi:hypothetical protein CCH79_00008073 [Gambusia affinis]|uniref:Cyclin-like domain-containing protein n=1 Tax=Gambusia affinis TaxID=33528 RepID=A0A315V3S2_GAMAF|nr:hypothetical protein CCH79_00008073 [Gambusia affinis]
MDQALPVSLWCEESEEDQGEPQGQSSTGGSPQLRARWDPSVSGHRVIQRLLRLEERYMPSVLYVTLIQRDPQRREEIAKWALEVCCDCGCDEAVFPLSVSLMDRYLSAYLSLPVSPFCLAAGCILIASKLTECETVTADALCSAAEFSFQPSDLRAVLQCYSEMIEFALRQRLQSGLQPGPTEKDEEVENERPGTPTDMREIDF